MRDGLDSQLTKPLCLKNTSRVARPLTWSGAESLSKEVRYNVQCTMPLLFNRPVSLSGNMG